MPCGHAFCTSCITEWTKTRINCPLCRDKIAPEQLRLLCPHPISESDSEEPDPALVLNSRLYQAVRRKNHAVLHELLEHANVNALFRSHEETFSHTLLDVAVRSGDLWSVEALVQAGHRLDGGDKSKFMANLAYPSHNPLVDAIKLQKTDIVEFLVASGAPLDIITTQDDTPLSIACTHNNPLLVRLLILAGACVNGPPVQQGVGEGHQPPIVVASHFDHHDVVKLLVEHGANVNAKSRLGRTALSGAAANGNVDIIKLLLRHRANLEARTTGTGVEDFTPLAHALSNHRKGAFEMLLRQGASPSALVRVCDIYRASLLMLAIQRNCDDYFFALLLNFLPEYLITNYRSSRNETAIEMAKRKRNVNARCWIEYGTAFASIQRQSKAATARFGLVINIV